MFGVSWHAIIVYFPIALAVAALGCDAWAMKSGTERYHQIGSALSKWAALAALVAVATGFSLAGVSGVGSRGTVTGHAGLGMTTAIVLSALAFVRYTAENRAEEPEEAYRPVWLAIQVVGAGLVALTALIGLRM